MTDDDRNGFEPEALPDNAGDPAAAFEALRGTVEDLAADLTREMTTIRKGVEAAFEEFERFQQPADYGPELGRVVQQLAVVGERLKAVEQTPILRHGAEHYTAMLERGGESLVRTASQQLERQATDLERAGRIVLLDHGQVQVTFFPENLPQWEAIQQAALGLLESFRVQ